jgi:hypothetical protein
MRRKLRECRKAARKESSSKRASATLICARLEFEDVMIKFDSFAVIQFADLRHCL